jgi:hypothetical protein
LLRVTKGSSSKQEDRQHSCANNSESFHKFPDFIVNAVRTAGASRSNNSHMISLSVRIRSPEEEWRFCEFGQSFLGMVEVMAYKIRRRPLTRL